MEMIIHNHNRYHRWSYQFQAVFRDFVIELMEFAYDSLFFRATSRQHRLLLIDMLNDVHHHYQSRPTKYVAMSKYDLSVTSIKGGVLCRKELAEKETILKGYECSPFTVIETLEMGLRHRGELADPDVTPKSFVRVRMFNDSEEYYCEMVDGQLFYKDGKPVIALNLNDAIKALSI